MSGEHVEHWPNHDKAWREWRAALDSARMHHGWIVAGKSGVGKRDFAIAAARSLVAGQAGVQPAGDHPDIVTLTYGPKTDKDARAAAAGKPFERARSIRVEQVRAMQRRLTVRPTLGERRVIIIDPADDMELSASNALLKSLEEPPDGTYFVLIAHRPARLLPTIRSRCRMLRVPGLTDSEIDVKLREADGSMSQAAREAAVRAAHGSFGTALRYAQQDLAPIGGLMRNLISHGAADPALQGMLAERIGPRADRGRIQAVLELAQTLVAEAARDTQSSAQGAALADTHAALVQLAREAPNYNFDGGLLSLQIGTLLMRTAPASEQADG